MLRRRVGAVGAAVVLTLAGSGAAPSAAAASMRNCVSGSVAGDGLRLCTSVTVKPVSEVAALFHAAARHASAAVTTTAAPAGWEVDPDPGSIPDFCNTTTTRVTDCAAAQIDGVIVDNNGTPKGTATLQTIYWQALSTKSLTWSMGGKAVVTEATGSAAKNSTVNGTAVCSANCSVAGNSTTKLPLVVNEFMRGSWTITASAPGATPLTSTQKMKITLASPAPTVPGSGTTPVLSTVRCDNSATLGNIGKGCVFPAVTPVFLLSGVAPPASPVHAAFVSSAQASLAGNPGRPDGTPLTRLADTAKRDANRAASCKGFVPTSSTDSCDEYPFASTYQGGAGAATAHVPGTDNSAGGSKLSAFNQTNRVLDKDPFFVQVVN
jgi:Deoxyribonuclease NucA/NucB